MSGRRQQAGLKVGLYQHGRRVTTKMTERDDMQVGRDPHDKALSAPTTVEADLQVGPGSIDTDDTTCPHCGESRDLAKVKGCIKCLTCGYKFDCNGW